MIRKVLKFALAAALVAPLVAGLAAQAQVFPNTPVARGRDLAQNNCASCHAIGEEDESPNPLSPLLRELSDHYDPDMLQEALAEGILTGHDNMPEFKLTPNQIDDLIAYLKSIQTRDDAAEQPSSEASRP
jgi:mono/diheme cytochrome c family protein